MAKYNTPTHYIKYRKHHLVFTKTEHTANIE